MIYRQITTWTGYTLALIINEVKTSVKLWKTSVKLWKWVKMSESVQPSCPSRGKIPLKNETTWQHDDITTKNEWKLMKIDENWWKLMKNKCETVKMSENEVTTCENEWKTVNNNCLLSNVMLSPNINPFFPWTDWTPGQYINYCKLT